MRPVHFPEMRPLYFKNYTFWKYWPADNAMVIAVHGYNIYMPMAPFEQMLVARRHLYMQMVEEGMI